MKDGFPVSIAELLAVGHRPLPSEAVAIVLDVCRQVMQQVAGPSVLPPVSGAALFIDRSGAVAIAGGVPVEDEQTVPLLGRLLLQMLPAAGTPGAARVPARLRLLALRAASGDPPRLTVARLAAALRRYGPEQPALAIRQLFDRWRDRDAALPEPVSQPVASASGASVRADRPLPAHAGSWGVRERVARVVRIGLMAAGLLVLLSMGATYWLHAKEVVLPPLPVSPTILLKERPAPPRGGWELIPDPAGLAVDSGDQTAIATDGPAPAAPGKAAQPPDRTGKRRAGTGAGLDAPFAHRADQ